MTKNNESNSNIKPTDKTTAPKENKSHGLFWLVIVLIALTALIGLQVHDKEQLNQKIKDLEMAVKQDNSVFSSRIDTLQSNSRSLENRLQQTQTSINESLGEKIQQIEEKLQNRLIEYASSIKLSESTEEKNEAAVTDNQQEAAARIITVEKTKTPDELLLASGALVVRDMAENGLPIVYETEVLRILAQNNAIAEQYVETIQKYANSGLKDRNSLIKDFNEIYTLKEAENKPQSQQETPQEAEDNTDWQQKAWDFAKDIVIQKKKNTAKEEILPVKGDDIYQLVNKGKFAEALQQIKVKNITQNAALREWQKQAEDYLDFTSAVNGLIMNALAHIKLKEFSYGSDK